MELPHVGKHCGRKDCNSLDFLPFECRLCSTAYCAEHRGYEHHLLSCQGRNLVDHKTISCPVCSQPVPGISTATDNPYKINFFVNRHISQGCPSLAKQRKAAKGCNVEGCKKTELIPFKCNTCAGQFCSQHRLVMDHSCGKDGKSGSSRSRLLQVQS